MESLLWFQISGQTMPWPFGNDDATNKFLVKLTAPNLTFSYLYTRECSEIDLTYHTFKRLGLQIYDIFEQKMIRWVKWHLEVPHIMSKRGLTRKGNHVQLSDVFVKWALAKFWNLE